MSSRRRSIQKQSHKRSQSRSTFALEVESLPAVKVDGRKIGNYAVVAQTGDIGKMAHFAVLAWTPEEFDYELQDYTVPKLYIFRTEDERNDFQQTLFD